MISWFNRSDSNQSWVCLVKLSQLSKIMWLITILSWFNRRAQFIFHVGPGRFGQLFSLNKWNHHLKTAFCIYLHYLCEILKFVWWSESFKCDKYAKKKKKKNQEGGKNLFMALCVCTCVYIYIYTHKYIHIYIHIYLEREKKYKRKILKIYKMQIWYKTIYEK